MPQRTIIEDANNVVAGLPDLVLGDAGVTPQQWALLVSSVQELVRKTNVGISLNGTGLADHRAGNLDGQIISVVDNGGTSDVTLTIPHGLGRVPVAVELLASDKPLMVYSVNYESWTDELLYIALSWMDKPSMVKVRVS